MEKSEFNALVEHYKNEMIELFNLKSNTSINDNETLKENQPDNMQAIEETNKSNNTGNEVEVTEQEKIKGTDINDEDKSDIEINKENNI